MKNLLSLPILLGLCLLFGCNDSEDKKFVRGVLMDIGNNQPIANTWVVLDFREDLRNPESEIIKLDSALTNSSGYYAIEETIGGEGVFKLTARKDDYMVIPKNVFDIILFNSDKIDTLNVGVASRLKVILNHESNDSKIASVQVIYRNALESSLLPAQTFVTAQVDTFREFEMQCSYDLNNTVRLEIEIIDNNEVLSSEERIIELTPAETETVEVNY